MHCEVMICNASDPNSQCAAPCPSIVRGKRAVNDYLDTLYTLAQGPILLSREDDEKQEEQPSHNDNINGENTETTPNAIFCPKFTFTGSLWMLCFCAFEVLFLQFTTSSRTLIINGNGNIFVCRV